LHLVPEKMEASEGDPLQAARPYLYDPDAQRRDEQRRFPALTLEPLTPQQAAEVYARYQNQAREAADGGRYAIPACQTPWDELHAELRRLLLNPLYLIPVHEGLCGSLGRAGSILNRSL
jgi:hypothetical protein